MDLILWRHASAEDSNPNDDLVRALTKHGRQEAEQVANWLRRHLRGEVSMRVSPARRTCQTADALGRPYQVFEALSTDGSAHSLLATADWPNQAGTVIVVGHQPTLGRAAALLVTGVEYPWPVERGAVWWLRARGRAPPAEIVAVIGPQHAIH